MYINGLDPHYQSAFSCSLYQNKKRNKKKRKKQDLSQSLRAVEFSPGSIWILFNYSKEKVNRQGKQPTPPFLYLGMHDGLYRLSLEKFVQNRSRFELVQTDDRNDWCSMVPIFPTSNSVFMVGGYRTKEDVFIEVNNLSFAINRGHLIRCPSRFDTWIRRHPLLDPAKRNFPIGAEIGGKYYCVALTPRESIKQNEYFQSYDVDANAWTLLPPPPVDKIITHSILNDKHFLIHTLDLGKPSYAFDTTKGRRGMWVELPHVHSFVASIECCGFFIAMKRENAQIVWGLMDEDGYPSASPEFRVLAGTEDLFSFLSPAVNCYMGRASGYLPGKEDCFCGGRAHPSKEEDCIWVAYSSGSAGADLCHYIVAVLRISASTDAAGQLFPLAHIARSQVYQIGFRKTCLTSAFSLHHDVPSDYHIVPKPREIQRNIYLTPALRVRPLFGGWGEQETFTFENPPDDDQQVSFG